MSCPWGYGTSQGVIVPQSEQSGQASTFPFVQSGRRALSVRGDAGKLLEGCSRWAEGKGHTPEGEGLGDVLGMGDNERQAMKVQAVQPATLSALPHFVG